MSAKQKCPSCCTKKVLSEYSINIKTDKIYSTCDSCRKPTEQCMICNKMFARKSNLSAHTRKKHEISGITKIKQVLTDMKITFKKDFIPKKSCIRWDFAILCDEPLYIEYHTKGSVDDTKKGKYLMDNNLLCLDIDYKDYGKIPELITEFITDNTDWAG